MNSLARDVALFLDAESVGAFPPASSGWAISVAQEPASPDDAITVYDTGGLEPDTDELDVFRPTIQVRVRSRDYEGARAKHEVIRELLIMQQPLVLATSSVLVSASSEIAGIGRDDNNRHILTANYRARRTAKEES